VTYLKNPYYLYEIIGMVIIMAKGITMGIMRMSIKMK
jgi:hypothetical protein